MSLERKLNDENEKQFERNKILENVLRFGRYLALTLAGFMASYIGNAETTVNYQDKTPAYIQTSQNRSKDLKQEIKDYLLGKTSQAPDGADANSDGKIDMADIIWLYANPTSTATPTATPTPTPEWRVVVDYSFPGPEFDSGNVFDYFVRAGQPATREAFRTGDYKYVEDNGLTMTGEPGTYDMFGVDESTSSSQRLTCYFEPLSMVDGSSCGIELGNNTRTDWVSVDVEKGLGYPIVKARERRDGVNSPIGYTIPYSGESLAFRATLYEDGVAAIEVKLGVNSWEVIATSDALDGIPCHATIASMFRDGFKPETTRYLLETK